MRYGGLGGRVVIGQQVEAGLTSRTNKGRYKGSGEIGRNRGPRDS